MTDVALNNTTAGMSGKTAVLAESAATITGEHTFTRAPSAPFGVQAGSAVVANLDADKVDGHEGAYFLDPANLSSVVSVAKGGTGVATLAAHGVLIGNTTSAVAVTGAGTAGQVLTSNGASADPTFQAASSQVWSLLYANASTSTSALAATVDSIAISGLGPRDAIVVEWALVSASAGTVNVHLYSVTDSIALTNKANMNANAGLFGDVRLNQDQSGASSLFYYNDSFENIGGGGRSGGVIALTTAWTGSWTLGLRHEGTSGTLRYRWAVYKKAGT